MQVKLPIEFSRTPHVCDTLEASKATAPAHTSLGHKSFLPVSDWKWMAFPLGLFLITRIALLGFAQIELMLTPDLFVPGGEQELLQHYPALDGLCRLGLPDLRQDRSHGLL